MTLIRINEYIFSEWFIIIIYEFRNTAYFNFFPSLFFLVSGEFRNFSILQHNYSRLDWLHGLVGAPFCGACRLKAVNRGYMHNFSKTIISTKLFSLLALRISEFNWVFTISTIKIINWNWLRQKYSNNSKMKCSSNSFLKMNLAKFMNTFEKFRMESLHFYADGRRFSNINVLLFERNCRNPADYNLHAFAVITSWVETQSHAPQRTHTHTHTSHDHPFCK